MFNTISKVYLFLIVFIVYAPEFGAIDMKATQWLYLSFINIIFLVSLVFKIKKDQLTRITKNPIFLSFLAFFIASVLSMINAINISLSIERLTDLFSILITLGIIVHIAKFSNITVKYILIILTCSLALDVFASLNLYRQLVSMSEFGLGDANEIRGFYGNKNITAAIIAFKIPLAIVLMERLKSTFIKALTYILLTLSFLTLLLLSARAVFLSVFISLFSLLLISLLQKDPNKKSFKEYFRNFNPYLIPLILSVILFLPLSGNSDSVSLNARINTVVDNKNDQSINQRLRFYGHALQQIKSTPILGSGIGNWRIMSIKYDSVNMYSYVVPFVAHNDLLEVFAETGIIGFIPFIIFIYLVFRLTFTNIKLWLKGLIGFNNVYLFLPFIVYFIDMNLNFPLSRPSQQIFLLVYILILIKTTDKGYAKV
jgi:O-antigen ligase